MDAPRTAQTSALLAAALGLGSAAISGYWALGGTGLLDTIGGAIERWGRQRGPSVLAALVAITVLKLGVALAAAVVVGLPAGLPAWTRGRVPRVLSWIAAIVLLLYGSVLTVAGWLVQAGVIHEAAEANRRALAWHAWFWDPWFALWGLAFVVALALTRSSRPDRAQH